MTPRGGFRTFVLHLRFMLILLMLDGLAHGPSPSAHHHHHQHHPHHLRMITRP